jgi:hypothetical protein
MSGFSYLQPYQLSAMRHLLERAGRSDLAGRCWRDVPAPNVGELEDMADILEGAPDAVAAHAGRICRKLAAGYEWGTVDTGFPGHPRVVTVLRPVDWSASR